MQPTIALKERLPKTEPMRKALTVIDFGNGQVKALVRASENEDFQPVSFPSYVATPTRVGSHCISYKQDDSIITRIVGEDAVAYPASHTGKSPEGKTENAKAILFKVLQLAFGDDCKSVHTDLIFTTPSNKDYGKHLATELEGVHSVTVPADLEVPGSQAHQFTVVVRKAKPQLEGHLACKSLELKENSWIVDIGNRTAIATKVSPNGAPIARRYFGGCGVRGMAEYVVTKELLAIKEATPEKVIEQMFSKGFSAETIQPAIDFCMAEVLAFLDDSPRFLIGGGAAVPGVAKALGAKKVKDAQWLNIKAIAAMSSAILEA